MARLYTESFYHRGNGTLAATSNNWEKAQEYFLKSVEILPTNATSMYLLGTAALHLGDTERAVEWLSKSLLCDPDFKSPYVNIGAAFLRQQRHAEAVAASEEVLARYPGTVQAEYNLGV